MAKSLQELSSDVSSINSAVKEINIRDGEFLKEQAYGVVSQEISSVDGVGDPLALGIIYLKEDMKGRMLRYSKVVLTFPDGSNPLIIPNDYGNQPGTSLQNQFIVKVGSVGAEVFPTTTYPVGSLILGLDYEANSINAAASEGGNTGVVGGLCVQYNSGGKLAETSLTSAEGGNENLNPFTFNHVTGEVQATKFKGDGSALTNLPAPSPSGSDTYVQFNDGGNLGSYSTFNFNKYSGKLSAVKFSGEHLGDNIGTGAIRANGSTKYWYLTPQDFMFGSSSTSPNYSSTSGLTIRTWQYYSSYGKYIATIQIPSGYKVVSVFIKGSANLSWSAGVTSWSSSSGGFAGSGVVNTEATGLNWTSVEGDFYAISIQGSGSTQSIYGARLTLEEV